jgi:hypothetical protein
MFYLNKKNEYHGMKNYLFKSLTSMLYEILKWPQIAPFCISSKQNPRPPPLSRIMACTPLSLSYAPAHQHLSTLNDLSAVVLATDMINKTHSFINIVSIEG